MPKMWVSWLAAIIRPDAVIKPEITGCERKLAIKPKVDVKNFGEDKGLEYIMSIELIPNIKIGDAIKRISKTIN